MHKKLLVIIGGLLECRLGRRPFVSDRSSVVKGFGNISPDNRRIIFMEWINEGLTLIFIGLLVFFIAILSKENNRAAKIVYTAAAIMLFSMAILSLFTGFKIDFIPFQLCPIIFTGSGLLILQGAFKKRSHGGFMKQWYESLFENYGEKYDKEVFTQGTLGECDFIEKEINYDKKLKILDIGCGTGRHTVELARRGYQLTGIDLSNSLLDRAREKALAQNLRVDFQIQDARKLPFADEFDLAIMLCEGAFPLMETDEMNYQILQSAARALKTNGKLIFTTLNGLFPLFHSVKDFLAAHALEGNTTADKNSFDLMTFREHSIAYVEDDLGNKKELACNERYYVPSEITWLLKSLNFRTIDIFASKLGAFSRNDKLSTEDFEMLVIAGEIAGCLNWEVRYDQVQIPSPGYSN